MEVKMKYILPLVCVIALLMGSAVYAEELVEGTRATEWAFQDAEGKSFTMASWAGKVLMINYVDPDESDLNEHFTDAVKKAKDVEKRLFSETYKGIGIADCAATWKPNFAIRAIAGKKAKKYNTTILFDYKAKLREAWGLQKDTSNIIVLDKQRVCRAIVRGRVDEAQIAALIDLMVRLQDE
jgi:predicted transcriptional regulator